MSANTAQGHHLLRCARFAHRIGLKFQPLQQFLGLVCPGRQGCPQQIILINPRHTLLRSAFGCFEQSTELQVTQGVRNGGIEVDA